MKNRKINWPEDVQNLSVGNDLANDTDYYLGFFISGDGT